MSKEEENDAMINITYFDSSDEESDDLDQEEEDETYLSDNESDEIDDETQEKHLFLSEKLDEIAEVIYVGQSSFRVNLFDKKGIKLRSENENCDFDIDDDGLPVMYDGGDSYLLPYLKELCRRKKDLSPLYITTNCCKNKYSF